MLRFAAGSIEFKRNDLASSNLWTLAIDKRPYYKAFEPEVEKKGAVGMDM